MTLGVLPKIIKVKILHFIFWPFLAILRPFLAILAATATPHLKFHFFFQNKVEFGQIKVCVKFQPALGFC